MDGRRGGYRGFGTGDSGGAEAADGGAGGGVRPLGLAPEELIASLEGLAKEVPALAPRLPLYAERIRDGGFALLVLLVGRGEVYLVGTEAPLELLPRGWPDLTVITHRAPGSAGQRGG